MLQLLDKSQKSAGEHPNITKNTLVRKSLKTCYQFQLIVDKNLDDFSHLYTTVTHFFSEDFFAKFRQISNSTAE